MFKAFIRMILLIGISVPVQAQVDWKAWSAESFALAKAEDKPIFLYLEAVWCHWCHVMQRRTLGDPQVQTLIARHFVPVRVDHDANPGLANRYRDYGWPAIIFLDADGEDLVKRAGYIAPAGFSRLLKAVAEDPTPEPAATQTQAANGPSELPRALVDYLERRHQKSFDPVKGGLRTKQKFVDRHSMEYALSHVHKAAERDKLTKTLDAATALLDPVWGGVYQYSTGGDWRTPHHEKIMRVQAGYLRVYALADQALQTFQYKGVSARIIDYLFEFLRAPEAAFYVSQDADLIPGEKSADYFRLDDRQRRAAGIPAIDRSIYADANGQAIEALALAYSVYGDPAMLDAAIQAARWITRHRLSPQGLMQHGEKSDTFHLSDSLHMAISLLRLYEVTGERQWFVLSRRLADAMITGFGSEQAGYLTKQLVQGIPQRPAPYLQENIRMTRFFNRLWHYSGDARHRQAALHGMKYLSAWTARKVAFEEAGILLANEELSRDPPHLTIVGAKSDEMAQRLFAVAISNAAAVYRRVEWWDPEQEPLPNHDVTYPRFERAAGYICTNQRCSRPSFSPEDYQVQIKRLSN